MKAVYEMPKVSFEAFMANDAVSACKGVKSLEFTCVEKEVKDENHVSHTDVFHNIVSLSLIQNGCTSNVRFADYVSGGQGEDSWNKTTDDNISTSSVDGVSTNRLDTEAMKNQSGFMGWLYFSQDTNRDTTYKSWDLDDDDGERELEYDNKGGILHAWLAPLFYWSNGGTYASN